MTTYKVMLGLLWTSTKCSLATKFIVKIDDNSVVDLDQLERALEEVDEGSDNILCPFEIRGLPIWRHPEVKFQKEIGPSQLWDLKNTIHIFTFFCKGAYPGQVGSSAVSLARKDLSRPLQWVALGHHA